MCCGILKCQRATTVSLAIILSFDNAVNGPWYFVITVLFEKNLFLSIGGFFNLCGWQCCYLFFPLKEILELLVVKTALL